MEKVTHEDGPPIKQNKQPAITLDSIKIQLINKSLLTTPMEEVTLPAKRIIHHGQTTSGSQMKYLA